MRIALPAAAFILIATGAFAQAPYSTQAPYQQGAPGQYDPQQGAPPPSAYQGASPAGMQGEAAMGQPSMGRVGGQGKFDAANVTHDGRLTRDQAQAGGLRAVARNFDAIDRDHKGYVTKQDLREWHRARRATLAGSQGAGQYPGPGASMQGPPPQ